MIFRLSVVGLFIALVYATTVGTTDRTTVPALKKQVAPEERSSKSKYEQQQKLKSPPGPNAIRSSSTKLEPIEPTLITHGPRDKNKVALTFDACETNEPAGYDERIIQTLKKKRIKATLFLGGRWIQSHRQATKELAGNSLFEFGNHSYIHPDFTKLSTDQALDEIEKTQAIIKAQTGENAAVFRFPFGFYNEKALKSVAKHGLRSIQWDVVTGDPDPGISAQDIIRAVDLQVRNGSIIIMHMNGRGWHTAEALPQVIELLERRGFDLVTVSELLGD